MKNKKIHTEFDEGYAYGYKQGSKAKIRLLKQLKQLYDEAVSEKQFCDEVYEYYLKNIKS